MKIKRKDLYLALEELVGVSKAHQLINDLEVIKEAAPVIHRVHVLRRGWNESLIGYYLGTGIFFDQSLVKKVEEYLTQEGIEWKIPQKDTDAPLSEKTVTKQDDGSVKNDN